MVSFINFFLWKRNNDIMIKKTYEQEQRKKIETEVRAAIDAINIKSGLGKVLYKGCVAL